MYSPETEQLAAFFEPTYQSVGLIVDVYKLLKRAEMVYQPQVPNMTLVWPLIWFMIN